MKGGLLCYTPCMANEPFKQPHYNPDAPVIILAEPQLGENVGMAARAMANFGLYQLRLVRPRDGWPSESANKAAAGAVFVTQNATVFESMEEALGDLNYVYATTARPRDMIKPVVTPQTAAKETRIRRQMDQDGVVWGRTGYLFGRERSGLENDEIALCDAICMAPVNPDFASINIAQAVLLLAYEWFKQGNDGSLGRVTQFDGLTGEGLGMNAKDTRPATKKELIGFFEHLEKALDESGFLWPPEKRPNMVRNLRHMFQRLQATERDVKSLRGIVASLSKGPLRKKHKD